MTPVGNIFQVEYMTEGQFSMLKFDFGSWFSTGLLFNATSTGGDGYALGRCARNRLSNVDANL